MQNPGPAKARGVVIIVWSCTTKGSTEVAKAENAWPAKRVEMKGLILMARVIIVLNRRKFKFICSLSGHGYYVTVMKV